MRRFLITWLLCPLLTLLFVLSHSAAAPFGDISVPLLIIGAPIKKAADASHERKLEKEWTKKWEQRLKDKTDIEAAANCVLSQEVFLNNQEFDDKSRPKLWLTHKTQCIQTVLQAWADAPKTHEQVIAVISAYTVLARDAEKKGDTDEAKRLRLKALAYLKQDAFVLRRPEMDDSRYDDKRVEYTYQYNGTGFIYNKPLILTLLNEVKMLDQVSKVCVYPRALESVFSSPQFKGSNFLRAACNYDIAVLELRKWNIIWDDESYTKQEKISTEDPCEEIKRYKPIGQGVFVLSSHPDGKGLIYTGEPYKVYQDGCLVKRALTNDKGELIFDYADESLYILEFFYRENILTERPEVLRPFKK